MRAAAYRFWLPPLLLIVHALLLLPVLLAKAPNQRQQSQYGGGGKGEEEESLLKRLHLKESVPLGVLGFLVAQALKMLAGKIPLPTDPGRRQSAVALENVILFASGVVEEAWRWGLVRALVSLEGGGGGFRGRGELWDLSTGLGRFNTKYPSIWEGVYVMGWVWSIVESALSWWSLHPLHHSGQVQSTALPTDRPSSPLLSASSPTLHNSALSEDSPRRPLLGKRSRSDYSGLLSNTDDSKHRGLFGSFYRKSKSKKRDLESGTNKTTRKASSSSRQAVQFADPATAKSGPHHDPQQTPTARTIERERPGTADSYRHNISHDEHNYGDDERSLLSTSASSADSTRYQAQTPLLSSSLPYDPDQEHPHFHHSYTNLSDSLAGPTSEADDPATPTATRHLHHPAPPTSSSSSIVEVHEDDANDSDNNNNNNNNNNNSDFSTHSNSLLHHPPSPLNRSSPNRSSPRRRLYPSFPSYTTAYNSSHFPASSAPSNHLSIPPHPDRQIYGLPVVSLPFYYPLVWRICAALRHVGHNLFFAWAPTLVFKGSFQWWCFLVLVLMAGRKGAQNWWFFGGKAVRVGMGASSAAVLVTGAAVYMAGLGIWGLL